MARFEADHESFKRWTRVKASALRLERPSDATYKGDRVPEAILVESTWQRRAFSQKPAFDEVSDEGTAFHALMERWAFGGGGELDEAMTRQVLEGQELIPHPDEADRVQRLLDYASTIRKAQPTLVERLAAVAKNGELYHEVPLRYLYDSKRCEGLVDLVWKDEAGWHLLDYKTGHHPKEPNPLSDDKLKAHFAQTRLYALGLQRLLGEPLVDFGLWYVGPGLVVRWPALVLEE